MSDDRKTNEGSSFSDRLFEAFDEAGTENEAVVREELIALGVDPDEVVGTGLQMVHELLGQQKLLRARNKYRRVREAITGLTQYAANRADDIRSEIARTLAGEDNEHLVLIYHRKLESIEPEDLASLDDEKRLLKLLRYLDEVDEE